MSRLLNLSSALSGLINFAKPGEMFEKYSPHSDWVQDPEASKLRKSVTRRKIPNGAKVIGGVPHIQSVDTKGVTQLRPAKAHELLDTEGYQREKHRLLLKTAQPDLEKKLAGASSEAGRIQITREHKAAIRKQLKLPPSEVRKEMSRVRGSMAEELGLTHRIMGGIRNEAERKGIRRPIGVPGNTGGHGSDRPLMIGESLPGAIHETKATLKAAVESSVTHRTKRAARLEGALRKRIGEGIQRTQTSEGRTPHQPSILNSKVHNAMEPFMREVPPNRSEFENVAGYVAKPGKRIGLKHVQKTRTLLDKLRGETGTYKHQRSIEDRMIKTGAAFRTTKPAAIPPLPRSAPTLKKIGIGAGAILAVGAGAALAKRAIDNKKKHRQPIAMSSKSKVIQLARGDIYTAVKTNLIGGTKLINAPKKIKQLTSLRIAAAKGDAAGFRERARELGARKMQIVTHRMQAERDRAASELRGLRIGARGVRNISTKLETANSEIDRLTRKVDARGAKISKLRGEHVSPGDAFASGQKYGETLGSQREALKHAESRGHFDKEIRRVASEKDAAHASAVKEIKGAQNKKIAIAAGAGVTAGGVAGYETGKDRKKKVHLHSKIDTITLEVTALQNVRNKLTPKRSTKIHDIATGGIEGGIGILATDPLFRRLTGEAASIHSALKQSLHGGPALLSKKVAIGAGIGAAATGLIGTAVTAVERHRKERKPITFAVQPTNRTAVTRDRYSKKIHGDDITKAENNYIRAGVGGAAISALLRKKTGLLAKPALLAGAATGIGIQAIVRNRTAKTKDQFGDRSFAGKRIDNAPGQAALLGAAAIATHKVIGGTSKIRAGLKHVAEVARKARAARANFSDKSKLIQMDIADTLSTKSGRERTWRNLKRSVRAAGDIKSTVKGERPLDARGRPKTREWEKPWVRNAAGIAILGATAYGVKGARNFVHTAAARDMARGAAPGGLARLSEVIKSGAVRRAAENKIPGVRQVNNLFRKAKEEVEAVASDPLGKIATRIEHAAQSGPHPLKVAPGITKTTSAGAVIHMPAGSEAAKAEESRNRQTVRKKLGKIIRGESHELSSRGRPIEFAEQMNDWDIRDPRGRSARVYAPGSQRRYRRPKRFHEREQNKKLIHQAELGGAVVAGTLLAGIKTKQAPIATGSSAGATAARATETAIHHESAIEKLLRETRLRRLSANLTNIIHLAA